MCIVHVNASKTLMRQRPLHVPHLSTRYNYFAGK